MNLNDISTRFNRLSAKRTLLQEKSIALSSRLTTLDQELSTLTSAQTILKSAATTTQNQLSFNIESIVTTCLQSIFPETYEFFLTFIEKRNKTEVEFSLTKNTLSLDNPLLSTGGGVVDLISFGLRIASLILSNKSRLLVLDEPFRNLSKNLHPQAGLLLRSLADNLIIQYIIISHDISIIEMLDSNLIDV